MKKLLLLLNIVLFAAAGYAQVGINTTTPGANSVLELYSQFSDGTYGGFMPPRITEAQRNTIPKTLANDGLMAYVTFPDGTRCLEILNGATLTWIDLTCVTPNIVWQETVGTASSTILATVHHSNGGFDHSSTCTYTNTTSTGPSVQNTAPISTSVYPNASGSYYLYFASGANRGMTIGNIDLTSQTGPFTLQVLIYKGTDTFDGSQLNIDHSVDGITWTNVNLSAANSNLLPTGTGTATWYQRTLSTTIANTLKYIRIAKTSAVACDFRIDDIRIYKP